MQAFVAQLTLFHQNPQGEHFRIAFSTISNPKAGTIVVVFSFKDNDALTMMKLSSLYDSKLLSKFVSERQIELFIRVLMLEYIVRILFKQESEIKVISNLTENLRKNCGELETIVSQLGIPKWQYEISVKNTQSLLENGCCFFI